MSESANSLVPSAKQAGLAWRSWSRMETLPQCKEEVFQRADLRKEQHWEKMGQVIVVQQTLTKQPTQEASETPFSKREQLRRKNWICVFSMYISSNIKINLLWPSLCLLFWTLEKSSFTSTNICRKPILGLHTWAYQKWHISYRIESWSTKQGTGFPKSSPSPRTEAIKWARMHFPQLGPPTYTQLLCKNAMRPN